MSSGPERPVVNVIWKPERPSSVWVTFTSSIDCARLGGTGTATGPGPIISVRWTPSRVMAGGGER